jgi:hypothetical protein
VFIKLPEMTLTIPYSPRVTTSHNTLHGGICEDSVDFMRLVAFLIRRTPEIFNYHTHAFRPLPVNFVFFFSSIFEVGLHSPYFNIVGA